MRKLLLSAIVPLSFGLALSVTPDASAEDISACGNINVEANAQCEVKVGAECKAECTPINFTASCYAECDGSCSASFEASCSASCEAECSGSCEADPGSFSCEGQCNADCSASCDGQCSSAADRAQCEGSCEATCNGECSASCEGTAPSASCEAQCSACCEGSCTAEANFDCQIECQGGCTAELTGGCEAECDVDGSLFCDGQYIDHGGNLEECIDALRAQLNIEVSGSAECEGGTCKAEGSASCNTAAPGRESAPWAALALLGAGVALTRRRRRA